MRILERALDEIKRRLREVTRMVDVDVMPTLIAETMRAGWRIIATPHVVMDLRADVGDLSR